MNYWHMQIHPDDVAEAHEYVYMLLEKKKVIGLGDWTDGASTIDTFINEVKVNDIVAIKNGKKLIALVQVIGGAYRVKNDDEPYTWIQHRRPIRVLDWEINDATLPQPRGTLSPCVDPKAETTKVIANWHNRVVKVMKKRGISIKV